jgi:hypothetical protein
MQSYTDITYEGQHSQAQIIATYRLVTPCWKLVTRVVYEGKYIVPSSIRKSWNFLPLWKRSGGKSQY